MAKQVEVAALLQARTGSSRLPCKVLADLAGRPMLTFQVERLRRSKLIDQIILATTDRSVGHNSSECCSFSMHSHKRENLKIGS